MRGNINIIDIIPCQGVLKTFLVLCLMFLRSSAFSPSVCDKICRCKFATVDCSDGSLRTIPDGIPNDTIKLDLNENSISSISDYSFKNLTQLQHLDLSYNWVTNIDNNAFVGPRQILSLNLTSCYLSAEDLPKYRGLKDLEDLGFRSCCTPSLSAFTFKILTRLRRLDLSNNIIKHIDQKAFIGLESLEVLILSGNELCLSELHPTVFEPLSFLINLSIFIERCNCTRKSFRFCSLSTKYLPKDTDLDYLEDREIMSYSIQRLLASIFKNQTKLILLNLSWNNIKYIDQEAFIGLESLEVLDLSQNELCLNGLHPTVFQPLRSLVNLLIFTEECNFACKPLKTNFSLPTLESLTIGVQDLPFDPITWGMTRLTFVSLRAACHVNISGNSFLHVDNITDLNLSCNDRSHCPSMMSDAFQNFLNLSTLFIGVKDFETIPQILSNALDNNCKFLRKIQIQCPDYVILSIRNLLPFENSKIKEFILEVPFGSKIVGEALRFLPKSLTTINIYLTFCPLAFDSVITSGFDELPNLSLFKIRTYKIQERPYSFCTNNHNIKRLNNVHKKDDAEEEESDRTNVSLISFESKKNYHKLPKLDKYQSFSSHVNKPLEDDMLIKTLKLDYSNNNYNIAFDSYPLASVKIDYLDISFNPIYRNTIPLAFGNIFSQVRIINLSNTKLSEIVDGTFQKITNLTHLDLKNNNLVNMFRKDFFFLQNLTNLNYLNLANNSITAVPKSMLKDARNLETLNLSLNQIVSINVDIYHTKLKTLNLSSNNIQFISNSYARQIEKLCKQSHLVVNLARNPLICTCDNLEFFQLTVSCRLTLQDAHLTYCQFENGTRASLDDMNRILDNLGRECTSKIPILVGSVVSSICLLFLFVGALAYRHRWKLRYLYYAFRLKWFQNTHGGAAYQRIFEYDAFVSYADTNHVFVRREMIPKLELENNIRLCVHQRDFIAGESVACNISRAIHSSKRTIIILTEDFLKSDWCMYELNMARVEDLYSDRNVILIIFLCDLDLGKLPLDALNLVQSKTYLKYPEEGTNRETFWGKCVEFIH